jgi:hypothetical protein
MADHRLDAPPVDTTAIVTSNSHGVEHTKPKGSTNDGEDNESDVSLEALG